MAMLTAFKNAFSTQCNNLLLSQVPGFLQAAQYAYKHVEGDCKIVWMNGTLMEVEGGLNIEAHAEIFDLETEEMINTFFVTMPIEEALQGDFRHITNTLIPDLQQGKMEAGADQETAGVTVH